MSVGSSPAPSPPRKGRDLSGLVAALPAWAASRVLVLASLAFAHALADTIGDVRPAVPQHLHRGLLGWDAERYYQIAEQGYAALPRIELRFFPLVPMLTRALDVVLPGGVGVALLVQANLLALLLGWLVYRLVVFEKGDAALGRAASTLVLLSPAAFVLVWGYTEAAWGCVTVGLFLAMRQERWWAAAAVGVLAGLTRPVAPLLCLPLLIEVMRRRRVALDGAAALVSPLVGAGLYLAWVGWKFGDALYPYTVQQGKRFRGSLTDPVTPLWNTAAAAFRDANGVAALRVGWAVVLVALVVVVFRQWPVSYGAFAAATLLVALGTQRLGSFERYTFGAFPVVLAVAVVVHRRPTWLAGAAAVGGGALTLYSTLALVGSYVP